MRTHQHLTLRQLCALAVAGHLDQDTPLTILLGDAELRGLFRMRTEHREIVNRLLTSLDIVTDHDEPEAA